MSILEKIAEDLKKALKSGDKTKLSVLRLVKAAIKNMEIEKGALPTDEDISGVLRSFAKKAKESIGHFSKAGRKDLVEKEEAELSVIQGYLPEQLGEDELRKIIKDVINETGASGPKDLGKVMNPVMAKLKGKADGKLVNKIVREILEA